MSNAIPKFDFSQSSIKSDEDLESLLKADSASRDTGKFFRPGNYQLTITNVTYQGQASDERWGKFLLTLEGVNGKTITDQILVPMRDVQYTSKSGKNTGFPYKRFKNFMAGIGRTVTIASLGSVLTEVFTAPEKVLVGQTVSVDIGYEGNYVGYEGKDEAGIKWYNITMRDGSVLSNAAGKPLTFESHKDAQDHGIANNIEIERFTRVLNYNEGKASAVTSNW